jgi:uridine nucleosidase
VEVVAGTGEQAGRTIVRAAGDGEDGVRIPRAMDVVRFWDCVEECVRRAEEVVGGPR